MGNVFFINNQEPITRIESEEYTTENIPHKEMSPDFREFRLYIFYTIPNVSLSPKQYMWLSTLENSAAQLRFAIVSLRNRAESRESVRMLEQNPGCPGWFRCRRKSYPILCEYILYLIVNNFTL